MEKMDLGVLAAQFLVFLVNALIYARQKSALDVEKRDRGAFLPMVQQAERVARDAASAIGALTYEHYEVLRAKCEALMLENKDLRVQIDGLKESVASLANKLASRDRADAARERRAAEREALRAPPPASTQADEVAEESGDPLAELIASGQAIPLGPRVAPAASTPPSHFGLSVRKKAQ